MPTIGHVLSSERLRQHLDLDDVARAIKISPTSLSAIEADDFDALPARIFARNFVRHYADYLRLNWRALVEQFDEEHALENTRPIAVPQQQFRVPRLGPSALAQVFDGTTLSAFFTFLLTIGVCGGLFWVFQVWRAHNFAAKPGATPVTAAAFNAAPKFSRPATAPPPARVPAPPSEGYPSVTPSARQAPAPPATQSPVQLKIAASEDCWTRITADGKTLFAGLLKAGESRDIAANEAIELRVGNAGGITLTLNGNRVQPVGPKGQVRTVDLNASGAQVRTPMPVPEAGPDAEPGSRTPL